MGNVIRGGIGVLFGLAVLIYSLFSGNQGGAYGAAKIVAAVMGGLLILAGAFYLINGLGNLSQEEPPRKGKKKKKRVRREEEN